MNSHLGLHKMYLCKATSMSQIKNAVLPVGALESTLFPGNMDLKLYS